MSKQILYTALGDSITGGFVPDALYGFAYRFYNYLKCRYCNVECKNLGCSGITSYGLLNQLKKSAKIRSAVRNADIITITIGGNNLLKSINNGHSLVNRRAADRYVESFWEDWTRIIRCIRQELSSEAQIYVMTLYNPLRYSDRNFGLADHYISCINNVIADSALMEDYEYIVADVYSCFENNTAKNWTFFYNFIISDPHPNREGHSQIFNTFKTAYNKNNFMT